MAAGENKTSSDFPSQVRKTACSARPPPTWVSPWTSPGKPTFGAGSVLGRRQALPTFRLPPPICKRPACPWPAKPSKHGLRLAEAQQQLALAEATVESWRSSAEQVRDRFEEGIRSSLDLRLALANLAGAEALLGERKRQLDRAVRQLEVLLGDYPDKSIHVPTELAVTPPPIPVGLPAEIISRRPDLVAAERRLASADNRVTGRPAGPLSPFELDGGGWYGKPGAPGSRRRRFLRLESRR